MAKSNQRITKIKRDPNEELLRKAEAMDVEDACQVQPQGMDLTPYPDMDNLRLWVRDYLLKGLNVVYNNDLSNDGQTYMTTIVDGLPLFTKLSKTIKQYEKPSEVFDIPYEQPELTANGTPGGDEVAMIFNHEDWYAFNISSTKTSHEGQYWQNYSIVDSEKHLPSYVGYYIPGGIKLTSVVLMNKGVQAGIKYTPRSFTIQGSNDNEVWTNLHEETDWSYYSTWNTEITIPITTDYVYKYVRINITSTNDGYVVQLGYMKLNGYTRGVAYVNVETSKPGLWLSNLCEPYQVSQAGGWLRQNLINDYYKEYTNLNSDTIGNYSFSYFQRGIIHRDAGSAHADNDSYCQHWSPSALGCISHDSLIIPTNNLRNTYTSYQTLAVPSNVNMQYYSETPSKDVEFTFVDNNDNIPLTTTSFNGRVVGEGWQYEFVFEPNYGGSGNNYGETGEDVPNGSNGGCVTGQIAYHLDNGDVCVQNIDKCFITDQALFNSYNHSTGDALEDKGEYIQHIVWQGTCGDSIIIYKGKGVILGATTTISNCCGRANLGLRYTKTDVYVGSTCTTGYGAGSSTVKGDSTVAETVRESKLFVDNRNRCCNAYGGTATLYFKKALEPQTNVTIYLNIWDLQKEYAAQGLPWAYTCEYDRFRVEISTQPCSDWYCKSFVIAENVDINDLGDISALQRVVFSGG